MTKSYYDRQWKIGELAGIFKVNVQLLRHYDKEGLLVPDIRNPDNKWRTYRYDQIYSLGMIRFLRLLDCSLDEIRSFMKGRNVSVSEKYLSKRLEMTKSRYEQLLRMERVVKERFDLVRSEGKYAQTDQIYVYSEGAIRFIKTGGLEEAFADELFYLHPTIVFYNNGECTFAVRISPEDAGEYRDRVLEIPPDDYLVGFHHGSYDNIHETFDKIRSAAADILEEGDALSDEVITMNIVDQLIEEKRDNFITKVMIRIIREG